MIKRALTVVAILIGVLAISIGLALLVATQTNLWVNHFEAQEPAILLSDADPAPPVPDSLRVMTYNIKFGGARIDFWFDCHGDRKLMETQEATANLQSIVALINKLDPDILLAQEVDFESDRSPSVNQVDYILRHTKFNHVAYASQWDVAWVPNGLGAVNSGNAVFSKWPIEAATRHALPLMRTQPFLTKLFYLRRNLLEVGIPLGGQTLHVLNTHLTAYDKDRTRKEQLDILRELARGMSEKGPLIIGGDLNILPPGTPHWHNFEDEVCQDEEFTTPADSAELAWLVPFYDAYQEVIPLAVYQANPARFFSHSVSKHVFWNRRLDYLFANRSWTGGQVLQSIEVGGHATMPLSDHAPVVGWMHLRP